MKAIEVDPRQRAFRLWAEQNAIRGLLSAGQLPEALAMISACAYCWGTGVYANGAACECCSPYRAFLEERLTDPESFWRVNNR